MVSGGVGQVLALAQGLLVRRPFRSDRDRLLSIVTTNRLRQDCILTSGPSH